MKPLQLLLVVILLGAVSACGSGGSESTVLDDSPGYPVGTSMSYVLIEPRSPAELDDLAEEAGATVMGVVPGTGFYRVSIPAATGMNQFMHRMKSDPRVLGVEADRGMSAPEGDGSTLPAGGLLVASLIPVQPALVRIGAEAAGERSTGMGVRVAVLDSGTIPHEFLDAHIEGGGWDFIGHDGDPSDEPNGIDDDEDGVVDEGFGHGTFVASLIVGVAPDATIIPFRVLDSDALGRVSNIAAAITMAVDLGAHVINLSVSLDDRAKVLDDAIRSARERGVPVIASAGNTGERDVEFPIALTEACTVTAVDAFDIRAPFASYGSEVDLSAPGVDLLGAFPSPTGTARWSGTSFSAAVVTGAFALLKEQDPGVPAEELRVRLQMTAFPVDPLNPEWAGGLGAGRLDLDAATAR